MPAVRAYRHAPSKRRQVQRASVQTLNARRLAFCTMVLGFFILSLWGYFHASTLCVEISKSFEGMMAHLGFKLEDVVVEGRVRTDKTQILRLLNLEHGKPLLSLNLSEAKAKLEGLSWVKAARVERRFPHTLFIRISEKEPVFLGKIRERPILWIVMESLSKQTNLTGIKNYLL